MTRPISLVILGIIAAMLVAGTFALLLTNHPIPDPVWVLDTAVITFLYGHGSFLAQVAAHQATIADLMDAVSTGANAASPTMTTMATSTEKTDG